MPSASPEELKKMTLVEKVNRYARDVMETENNPEFLRIGYVIGGDDGIHGLGVATYPASKNEFIYDFLLGKGSLGYPLKPTSIGERVYRVAEIVGTKVMFLDFTYPKFFKQITTEAIGEAFFSFFEESDGSFLRDQVIQKLGLIPSGVTVKVGRFDMQTEEWRVTVDYQPPGSEVQSIGVAITDAHKNIISVPELPEFIR